MKRFIPLLQKKHQERADMFKIIYGTSFMMSTWWGWKSINPAKIYLAKTDWLRNVQKDCAK